MKNPKMHGRKKLTYDVGELYDNILAGDPLALSRAITLVESQAEEHMELAAQLLEKCIPHSGQAHRIGITGSPGVGKSTFIESWGLWLIEQGYSPAILAVDPSSTISGGSLLGDKTRMEQLSMHEKAYIRPSPASHTLGGVAHATRETIILCEAAGFNPVLIETVGVGQSETLVRQMVDFFILLILPGAGDDLQGIKRGIVEMADLICVNKADGERKNLANKTQKDFKNALHLFSREENEWQPEVVTCSALEGMGIQDIWQQTEAYFKQLKKNEQLQKMRNAQDQFWLEYQFHKYLESLFLKNKKISNMLKAEKQAIREGSQSLTGALLKLKRLLHEIIDFNN